MKKPHREKDQQTNTKRTNYKLTNNKPNTTS